ncbi:DUF3397 domain-containing protein [Salisediminibacterium halotolerans]|uniref:DUF3397 domain-containing protein n=1 Tax=Salisediminibacterium halotolerans TaxID=517425 RepID=A0A1H9PU01_9BACI|nr:MULTISPECIES: DUF3397 domain-containing protein [Salisediminibacterium]RLJ74316.1 uncharacterized protein DUF3397 [Actinophytocola xinjiangensis]RPE87591.1 uncharacterized protein DUF3397 [Salisediminibacterium halotolerans]TWG35153.1 uncharacterized protein DUF3397 [Salisediminibacterium halotolerans]SER51694.1 Protein of unknown function [Salisediminibacterium haloalkalitolerans]GEL09132.1 hypothetical protein SHA02_25480 [Salisediminibacterium halotolerans]
MINVAAGFVATIVTAPVIAFFIVYYAVKKTGKAHKTAFKRAVDFTVLLFMLSVYFIVLETWGLPIGWWILLGLLITAVMFTIYHWRHYDDIDLFRLVRGVWRMQFIIYFSLYWILVLAGFYLHMSS